MTRINTSVLSLIAQSNLLSAGQAMRTSLWRLSTGLRINTGADDPAGLIASEMLRSEMVSLESQLSGAQRAVSMASTADGALGEVSQLLLDIKGVVTQAANSGGATEEEIEAWQMQIDAAVAGIENLGANTEFGGQALLDGYYDFEIDSDTLGTELTGYLESLKTGGDNELASGNFTQAGDIVDAAISQVATHRGQLGAEQTSYWESAISSMSTTLENISMAESLIRDADYAVEMAGLIRSSILSTASLSLLAMANSASQNVLALLSA